MIADDPDALYEDRANLASAQPGRDLLTAATAADPTAFDPAWKLARICYWLGAHGPEAGRRAFLERGITAGQAAAVLAPQRPEGHFWMAANMGALAESFGVRAGLKYRKPIKESLETALRIDPAFMEGSADRALGRWLLQSAASLRWQQQDGGSASARVVEIQSQQCHHSLLPRRVDGRSRSDRRGTKRAQSRYSTHRCRLCGDRKRQTTRRAPRRCSRSFGNSSREGLFAISCFRASCRDDAMGVDLVVEGEPQVPD